MIDILRAPKGKEYTRAIQQELKVPSNGKQERCLGSKGSIIAVWTILKEFRRAIIVVI